MISRNTLPTRFLFIIALAIFPFVSFGHEGEGEPPTKSKSKSQVNVSNVKKMTRYSLAFEVDLPTVADVLTYISEDLGIQIQDIEEVNDPNWNPSSLDARNFKVEQNENGTFEVQVRFYPPVDPMSVENVGSVQRDSRLLCTETVELLKSEKVH